MKSKKTQEELVKGETARLVHKDFFDRCQNAIDNQFYLEAIFMEYSAIEGRVKKILTLLNLDCAGDYDTNHSVGLSIKLNCLINFLEDKNLFGNSKLTRRDLARLRDWLTRRDHLTHALYTNTEKYSKSMNKNGKFAIKGKEFARKIYDETERLKKLKAKHPEYFENTTICICKPTKENCKYFLNQMKEKR